MLFKKFKKQKAEKEKGQRQSQKLESKIISVFGDVQGVFYRYHAKKEAQKLGLVGWAKNELDGSVTILVQGENDKIDKFIDWSWAGSPLARVEKVDVKKANIDKNIKGFDTR